MSVRAFNLVLTATPTRLSDVYGGAPGAIDALTNLAYRQLQITTSGATAFLGVPTPGSDRYAAQVRADGATVYWRCNEASGNLTDVIGGQVGTAGGTITYQQPGALANGDFAIKGDGATGLITGPSIALAFPFSFECWVNQKVTQVANIRIMGVYGANVAKLHIQTGIPTAFLGVTGTNNAAIFFQPGTWHHVVMTADGATLSLYVDGSFASSIAAATLPSASNLIFLAGQTSFFNGLMDEVALYPSALTPAQVARHYALATATDGGFFDVPILPTSAPLILGPYDSGPLKLSNFYAAGAGATLSILGIPF